MDPEKIQGLIQRLASAETALHQPQSLYATQSDPQYQADLFHETIDTLRQIEEHQRQLVEFLPLPIMVLADGNFVFLNSAALNLFGARSPEEMIGKRAVDFVHPDDRNRVLGRMDRLYKEQLPAQPLEEKLLRLDGSTVYVKCRGNAIPFYGKTAALVIIEDISEQQRAEEKIHLHSSLLGQVRNSVKATDLEGRIIFWNRHAEILHQWKAEEVLGRNIREITMTEESRARAEEIIRALNTEGYWEGELLLRRKDGSSFRAMVYDSVLRGPDGKITGFVGISTDITDRLKLEAQLRQAQKLESIGQLAGGIAHDFNNILTVIQGHSGLLLQSRNLQAKDKTSVQQIHGASERAANLVQQLLAFSRRQILEPKTIDLNHVVRNMTRLLLRILSENITLRVHCDSSLPPICGDQGMIEQILLNLVVNSRDALPKGGQIKIETTAVQTNVPGPTGQRASHGISCRLTVSDDGCGIAPENLGRIFEPFFTTKEAGKGTGLGLATVHGIVIQHHGRIEVESEVHKGTTFKIYFPATEVPMERPNTAEIGIELPSGNETILVVEDEEPVRTLLGNMLEPFGYKVVTAGTAREALTVWSKLQNIHLVITDMVMPGGMTGLDLVTEIQKHTPALKYIFISGYSPEISEGGLTMTEGYNYLRKPLDLFKLAQTVRARLDEK